MEYHSPPTTMKPKNHTRNPSDAPMIVKRFARLKRTPSERRCRTREMVATARAMTVRPLAGDDQRIARLPQHGRGDAAIEQRVPGKGRLHAQHMAHESVVRVVIG